jgi:type I restriction-modification system DNA methylase subunit
LNKRFPEYVLIYGYIDNRVTLKEIDDLVTVFEILVNDVEKKNNGVVYTPVEIKNYITHDIIENEYIPKIIDPACGCGAFLISAAKRIHDKYSISYKSIYENYIWGCDIDAHSIEKAKLLFNITSLEEGNETIEKYNLLVGNSLSILACDEYFHKYDVVVGNPPYVRAKNIDEKVKESLSKWSVVTGNVDLYIPFFQLGVELLNNNGKLGYISPNTYLQSVNGRGLRNYFRDKKVNVSIINFKDSQKFQDVTHYTCITIIDTANLNGQISYSIYGGDLYNCNYTSYNILQYSDGVEWRFGNSEIDKLMVLPHIFV